MQNKKLQTTQNSSQYEIQSIDERISQPQTNSLIHHKNYGQLIPIMINRSTGQPKYLLGPHFYIFIPTWFFSFILIIMVLSLTYSSSNNTIWTTSLLCSLIYLYIYLKIGFSHPGVASAIRQPSNVQKNEERYCIPCKIIRKNGTRHCYFCDVCIYGQDHHCPWIGKCVGRDNLCLFYGLLATFTVAITTLFLAIGITKNK